MRKDVEKMGMAEELTVIHRDKDGRILSKRVYPKDYGLIHNLLVKLGLRHNTMTATGFAHTAYLLGDKDNASASYGYIAIGTNNTAATVDDTALGTEVVRKTAVFTRLTTVKANDTAQWTATFSSADNLTGTMTIYEVGVFNDSTAGDMLTRIVYAGDNMNWDAGDTLEIRVKVQIKQGT
ncbi:MAG: hypothetical protein ACPLKS_06120 [Caldisericum exile]|uniref:hypothetical protein n=1 Tax=Caldisericum exile TaxID=693075 RepID=UPI003C74F1B6